MVCLFVLHMRYQNARFAFSTETRVSKPMNRTNNKTINKMNWIDNTKNKEEHEISTKKLSVSSSEIFKNCLDTAKRLN